MPYLEDKEFYALLEQKIAKIIESVDFHAELDELTDFVQYESTQTQREHMLQVVLGFGKEDYLGSTKLGPGTGIILHGPLGQGTELGSIDGNRLSSLQAKLEAENDSTKVRELGASLRDTISRFSAPTPHGPRPY